MSRHDTLIIKDTHRGLLYEDGVFREVLPAGRYQIPRGPSPIASFFGTRAARVEVLLVDVRGRDRTVVVPELMTADGATISASFVVQFRVADPVAALHRVKNFEERLFAEAQTAARRMLRGLSVEEVLGGRDEIGEEILRLLQETAPGYGLEVTGLDFKDLIVPGDLRKAMNRAVLAKRLRQLQLAGGRSADDDAPVDDFEDDSDEAADDDSAVILSRATFARARDEAESRPESFPIRAAAGDMRAPVAPLAGFDAGFRRCQP